jgi:hypothetical protein
MNTIVNPRVTAVALIAALAYEILIKIARLLVPAVFARPGVPVITMILTAAVGVMIIVFLFSFYDRERAHPKVAAVTALTIGVVLLGALLRLPILHGLMSFETGRLVGFAIGAVSSCLLFLLILYYLRVIPAERKGLKQAAVSTAVLLGLGAVKSLYALGCFVWFLVTMEAIEPTRLFNAAMFFLFLLTHISLIWFLIRYRQHASAVLPAA